MRMCMTSTVAICLICLVALTGCPRGNNAPMSGVIFDNSAYYNDAIFSDFRAGIYSASSFSLNEGASTVTDVHWWGIYGFSNTPPPIDIFTIVFYEDDGGTPGSAIKTYLVDAGRTDTGDTAGDYNIYAYSVSIPPLALTAKTTYWISIYTDTTGLTVDYWLWLYSTGGWGSLAYRDVYGQSWASSTETLAFTLTNDGVARAQEAQLTQPTRFDSRRPLPYTAKGGGSVYVPFARSALEYGSKAAVCL